jgi:hypothetical protein
VIVALMTSGASSVVVGSVESDDGSVDSVDGAVLADSDSCDSEGNVGMAGSAWFAELLQAASNRAGSSSDHRPRIGTPPESGSAHRGACHLTSPNSQHSAPGTHICLLRSSAR